MYSLFHINKPKINDFSWLYVSDKDILTHKISFPSNYSKYVSPKNNSSILSEITFREGDIISKMNEKEITERVINDLEKLKIINEKDVIITTVHKFKYAYIIYDLEYKENLRIISNYLKEIGIDSIGRFGRWEI